MAAREPRIPAEAKPSKGRDNKVYHCTNRLINLADAPDGYVTKTQCQRIFR